MAEKYSLVVRLYRHTDLDLIALLDTEGFSLPVFTKTVLKSFADKKIYYVDIPKPCKITDNDRVKNERQYIVYLDKENDSEVIRLFDGVKKRYRNGFIKGVIRKYIFGSNLSVFFEDTALESEYYGMQMQLGVPVVSYQRLTDMKTHILPDALLSTDAVRIEPKDAPVTAIEDTYENTKNVIPTSKINDIIKEEKVNEEKAKNIEVSVKEDIPKETNNDSSSSIKQEVHVTTKLDNMETEKIADSNIEDELSFDSIATEEEETEFDDMFATLMNS